MSDSGSSIERTVATPGWDVIVDERSGEAFRPNAVIVTTDKVDELLARIGAHERIALADDPELLDLGPFADYLGRSDVPSLVRVVMGGVAGEVDEFIREFLLDEPDDSFRDVVFLADSCRCIECPPHPVWSTGHPHANPVWANPVWANPVWANPVWANPVWANGRTSSSALPSNRLVEPRAQVGSCVDGEFGPTVIILDTGLADLAANAPLLPAATVTTPDPHDEPDANIDDELDPVAGHGTFIAGLVELASPGATIVVRDIVEFRGDTTIWDALVALLEELLKVMALGNADKRLGQTIVGMSFSGPMAAAEAAVARKVFRLIRDLGVVIVASAGNEATCQRVYPAGFGDPTDPQGLANVVSVGALGPCGPAEFTNYGCWVRACAAGVALTSSFFDYDELSGQFREFDGWATWSGTSFSVGIVAGALVREIRLTGSTGSVAVARLVDTYGLPSIPGLGAIVT